MPQEFHDQLISFMPKMRVWALALTRNRAAADDLDTGCSDEGAGRARIASFPEQIFPPGSTGS